MKGHSTIVVGSLWGDEGKGKISAIIAHEEDYDIAVRAGTGTNAGHSMTTAEGIEYKTNQLPLAGILPNKSGKMMTLAVGSGVCVDPDKLEKEVMGNGLFFRTFVDYRCPVIKKEHIEREESGDNYGEGHTGSTKSGTGEARVDMVRRVAERYGDKAVDYVADVAKYINDSYDKGEKIIIEGSQAHYLSLYLSDEYPVVTSDNCTAGAFADDVGLSWNRIDDVCIVIKSAPTRESQGCGDLPKEMSQTEMEEKGVTEHGVTTGRARRKSLEIPFELLKDVFMINSPTYIALTFCDHVDSVKEALPFSGSKDFLKDKLPKTYENINKLEKMFGVPVRYVEYGKTMRDVYKVEG